MTVISQIILREVEVDLFCGGNYFAFGTFDCLIGYHAETDHWEVDEWRYANGKPMSLRSDDPLERILVEKLYAYANRDGLFHELVERHLPHVDHNAEHRLTARELV